MYPLLCAMLCASFLPSLLVLFVLLRRYKGRATPPKRLTYNDIRHNIHYVLGSSFQPLKHMLQQRADANRRLVRALELTNTFVSGEEDVHARFVQQASALLRSARTRKWSHLQSVARDAVQWHLKASEDLSTSHSPIIAFDTFVQNVTVVVILVGLLEVDIPISQFNISDVDIVTRNINNLWVLSKSPEPIPPHLLPELNDALRRLVPDRIRFPNPLDFVVPTWETLWRVVATTVAYSHADLRIREIFEQFMRDPTEARFTRRTSPSQALLSAATEDFCLKDVVYEAMRLHPPSRRIGRAKAWPIWPSFLRQWMPSWSDTQHADIGALLKSDLWGDDASCFNPSRHATTDNGRADGERKEALELIFGKAPLQCIAASWAPIAAATIAGSILEMLNGDEYFLEAGKDIGSRAKWNGWSVKQSTE